MSTDKTKRAVADLKVALKQLKSIGVPQVTKYDARKPLTKHQKEVVRKHYRQHEEILTARSQYAIRSVKQFTDIERKILTDKGMTIINDRLFINKEGRDKISVRRKTDTLANGTKVPIVKIKKEKNGFLAESELHMPSHLAADYREHLMRQYIAGNFKEGEYIGIKIGNGGVAKRQTLLNMSQVYGYLDEFEPKDPGTSREELLKHVTLIKIHAGERSKIFERTAKEKRKVSAERSKNRKKVSNKLNGKVKRSK